MYEGRLRESARMGEREKREGAVVHVPYVSHHRDTIRECRV